MKLNKLQVFVVITLLFVTVCGSQSYRIQNGIGVYGGLTQFDVNTDDFITERQNGWLIGLAATVDIPHRFYNVSYNIQLSENQMSVLTAPSLVSQTEFVDYKLFTAQVALVGHIKIIGKNLTLDIGPQLQYNSNFELKDDTKENHIVVGYNNITAADLSEISRFNVNATTGLTAGFDSFKVRGQYIYGFTNILGKLNDQNFAENSDFKGNQGMFVFSAMFVF